MDMPRPLPDPLIEMIAQRFRVIGEPMRIRLLDTLRDGEMTVTELVEATGATQQNVSKHLGVLHQAGIVARRKDGNFVRYSIGDETMFAMCELVCGRTSRPGVRPRPDPRRRCSHERPEASCSRRDGTWPLERVLFAMAGTMTLISVVLVALVSPWFLILTALVGEPVALRRPRRLPGFIRPEPRLQTAFSDLLRIGNPK